MEYQKKKLEVPGVEFKYNYSIDTNGRIFNDDTGKVLGYRIATQNGYALVGLYTVDSKRSFTVHRLVALNFLKNPENLPQVNHIDCNKLNNNVENLEWCTASYNIKHAYKNNLMRQDGEHHAGHKLSEEQVKAVIKIGYSKSANEIILELKLPCITQTIDSIRLGQTWKHLSRSNMPIREEK